MITAERRYSSVEFASSISHESRLVADPYVLWWTEKGLYSPNHRCLVRSCIQENSPDMAAYDFLEDVVRKDEVKECAPEIEEKIIGNFPDKLGKLLKVKAVFD